LFAPLLVTHPLGHPATHWFGPPFVFLTGSFATIQYGLFHLYISIFVSVVYIPYTCLKFVYVSCISYPYPQSIYVYVSNDKDCFQSTMNVFWRSTASKKGGNFFLREINDSVFRRRRRRGRKQTFASFQCIGWIFMSLRWFFIFKLFIEILWLFITSLGNTMTFQCYSILFIFYCIFKFIKRNWAH